MRFQRLKASNGLWSLHFLSLMSRGALMRQPIDQPSPVKAARGVQELPTCGQSRPASSARRHRATLNFERAGLDSPSVRERKRRSLEAPREAAPLPLHPNFSTEKLPREAALSTLGHGWPVAPKPAPGTRSPSRLQAQGSPRCGPSGKVQKMGFLCNFLLTSQLPGK